MGIVFTAYSIYGIMGYINAYAINMYGLSESAGATLGGVRYLIQGFGGILGGLLILCFGIFLVMPVNARLLMAVGCMILSLLLSRVVKKGTIKKNNKN